MWPFLFSHRQALDLAKAAAPETPETEAPAPAAPEPKRSSMLSFRSPLHRARSGLTAFNLDKSTEVTWEWRDLWGFVEIRDL